MDLSFLEELTRTIKARRNASPEESYTARLFNGGPKKVSAKIMEEAAETAVAALVEDKKRLIEEAADLIYHLLVLLELKEASLAEVIAELETRHR